MRLNKNWKIEMRTQLCGLIAVATLAVGLLALPAISAGDDADQKSNLDELLKQRRDTLQQVTAKSV